MRRVTRSTSATRTRVQLGRRCAPSVRANAGIRTSRGAAPARTRRTSRLCAAPCRWRPCARPSRAIRRGSPMRARSPTVAMPCACSLAAVTAPTPHSLPTGSGCRNASSSPGATSSSPSGLASPLTIFASSFVVAIPTLSGRPTRSRTLRRSATAISRGEPADAPEAADVEEGLVDRDPLDDRRGLVEDLEDRAAGLDVGLKARPHDDRLRAQPARLRTAHRRAHAERAGLVACGEHDAAADDHRPCAQLAGRRAARPTQRRRRGRHAGSRPRRTRTHVRITAGR